MIKITKNLGVCYRVQMMYGVIYILKICELEADFSYACGSTAQDQLSEILRNMVAIRGHMVDIPGWKRIEKKAKNRSFSCP